MWGYCNATEIQHLQRFQNKIARVVTNSALWHSYHAYFGKIGVEATQQLIVIKTKITACKFLKNLVPQYLSSLFSKSSACTSRYLCSTNTNLRLPKMNTT